MRNLTARLREIVGRDKTDTGSRFSKAPGENRLPVSVSGFRELTYVADGLEGSDVRAVAHALGGTLHASGPSTCVVIDRVWDAEHWHGRGRVSSFVPEAQSPIGLFDPRIGDLPEWARRPVFFDVETTGLSGGAGTLAFLAACGWFQDDGGFRVRQFFLAGPAGEPAMLDALGEIFGGASMLVSFNGRTFDVPLMETRWAFHRRPCPTDDLPHFDMLPPARQLWGRRDADTAVADTASCSLSSLERAVLGFHRVGDVPGIEIPGRYFHFLRSGDAGALAGVIEHNQHDLVSLAALLAYALTLASGGPEAAREPAEQLALGRLYERGGDSARAAEAYALAAAAPEGAHTRAHALARLATLRRREARYDEAAAAWQGVIAVAAETGGRPALSGLTRQAAEALAIHHEHRAHDLTAAKRYAQTLRGQATGRAAADLEHRIGRIDRKIKLTGQTTAFGWDGGEGS
jgi:hypothetical protein